MRGPDLKLRRRDFEEFTRRAASRGYQSLLASGFEFLYAEPFKPLGRKNLPRLRNKMNSGQKWPLRAISAMNNFCNQLLLLFKQFFSIICRILFFVDFTFWITVNITYENATINRFYISEVKWSPLEALIIKLPARGYSVPPQGHFK